MRSTLLLFAIVLLCFTLFSCNEEKESPLQEEITVMTQLTIGPSIEYGETPMSRAGLDPGIYAINVFWKGKSLTSYQPYASGLFDDVSNVSIGLITGYEYRFDCTFLRNDEITYVKDGTTYGLPFSLSKEKQVDAQVTNKLTISINPLTENTTFHQSIYYGAMQMKADSISLRPVVKRFYGSAKLNFTNASPSPTVALQLKRAYYSVIFKTKELTSGDSIKIEPENAAPLYITNSNGGESASNERLLCFKQVGDFWTGEIKEEEGLPVTISYRSATKGEWQTLFSKVPLNMKRNKQNIANIVNIENNLGKQEISFEGGSNDGLPSDGNELEIGK